MSAWVHHHDDRHGQGAPAITEKSADVSRRLAAAGAEMMAHKLGVSGHQRISSTPVAVWVKSVDYADGVAYGRGRAQDGTSVDFAAEPRALCAISEALDAGDGPVLATIPSWWSMLLRPSPDHHEPGNTDLVDWLDVVMRDRGLSQRQVASRAGVDHATVSRVLAGRVPTVATLGGLARVFGWPPFGAIDRGITKPLQVSTTPEQPCPSKTGSRA